MTAHDHTTGPYSKWVAVWANAISIRDQLECRFAKDLTLRYPIRSVFSGDRIRLHFSNLTGTEPVRFTASVAKTAGTAMTDKWKPEKNIDTGTLQSVYYQGNAVITIPPGEEIMTDEIIFPVTAGDGITVSLYLPDYTDMNSAVLIQGAWSGGFYSYGDHRDSETLPRDLTRNTGWYTFLNALDVRTAAENHAVICYGDSITAQDWPDELAIRLWASGNRNTSIVRRAVCGTRILREYGCITYAAYGLRGERRFTPEMNVSGADTVILQHGINDIIHPVGTEVNVFRPMSDLPTLEEMITGVRTLYLREAAARHYRILLGTLLPIKGWRTYAPFREDLKNAFNDWIRGTVNEGLEVIDFDKAVRDPADTAAFRPGFDSGDHLHPSLTAYQAMAEAAEEALKRRPEA